MRRHSDLTTTYLRWSFARAVLARGYWSTAAVYLVVVADLEPSQLVLIGVFQSMTSLVAEVPAGVFADTVGRRASLLLAHVLTGAGMASAGLLTSFPLLVATQCLWGIGWAFASGADVAWLTDEAPDSKDVDRTLVAQTRWDLIGAPLGMLTFAALASVANLAAAIVSAGAGMALLGLSVVRWPEDGFVRLANARSKRESAATTLRAALGAARRDRVVRSIIVATALVFGGVQAFGRLREQRLLALGVPTEPDPVVWLAALGVVSFIVGALVLRILERRISGASAPWLAYVSASVSGAIGLLVVANVGRIAAGAVAVVLVTGIADPVVRTAATVAINRRIAGPVRATVQSLLWQSTHVGVIVFGLSLAAIAAASPAASLTAAAALLVVAATLVFRSRELGAASPT